MTVLIGTADAGVANLHMKHPVIHERPDLGLPSVRVLDDVRERLGHDEVRTSLDLRREPLRWNIDFNREVDPRRDTVDAGPQAAA